MKKAVIIHTSFISVETLNNLFAELLPEVEVHNIVDDTMLPEIMQNGGVTQSVIRRYCAYAIQAESVGADLVFNQCSSAGPAADVAAKMLNIPVLKVDQAMAEKAVERGGRIAVIATIGTTLNPSVALIRQVAEQKGKAVDIDAVLLTDAYEALFVQKDTDAHDAIIMEKIRQLEKDYDAIVLAQGSMVSLLDKLEDISVPLLTSPRPGVESARAVLGLENRL